MKFSNFLEDNQVNNNNVLYLDNKKRKSEKMSPFFGTTGKTTEVPTFYLEFVTIIGIGIGADCFFANSSFITSASETIGCSSGDGAEHLKNRQTRQNGNCLIFNVQFPNV